MRTKKSFVRTPPKTEPEISPEEIALGIVEDWLASKGVTLWASWDLSQPERLRIAAKWFYDANRDFGAWAVANNRMILE